MFLYDEIKATHAMINLVAYTILYMGIDFQSAVASYRSRMMLLYCDPPENWRVCMKDAFFLERNCGDGKISPCPFTPTVPLIPQTNPGYVESNPHQPREGLAAPYIFFVFSVGMQKKGGGDVHILGDT